MSGLRKLELIYPTPSLVFEETTSIFSPFHIEQTLDFTLDLLNPSPTPFDLFLGSPFAIPTQLALPRANSVSRTESYLNSLSDRIAALEDTLLAPKPKAKAKVDRKYTWTAQISSDEKDGLDRKYKLTTKIKGGKKKEEEKKYKWTAEIKGKGENSKLNHFFVYWDDASKYFDLELSYITASPLGVPQQVIAVNGKFPGPTINVTTNQNVIVNVRNRLNENALVTWPGIQMRRTSWQDGVRGTNCPIPPNWNWTYQFQVKDQIGSFFYFPSLNFQRASGGFGSFIITNRNVIPIPFNMPDGDIVILIGDWYTREHSDLRTALDSGKDLGMPDGVLINGKGPYQYNASVPDGIGYETFNVDPGKTYRIRVHNVGVSTCLNFRIQSHYLILAETEGYYTAQSNYTSLDIHVGQSYSFLVTMDQNASSDYYIVASPRFVNESVWQRVTGVAILHYSNSKGKATDPLPDPPNDGYDKSFVVNQALSIRQNTSASGARPNPQGSFHYGQIQVTDTIILKSVPPTFIDGRLRATLNGISFAKLDTPIRLADKFNVKGLYKLDFPTRPFNRPPRLDISVINATYKGFIEIVLQNNDTIVQSFHMDGYSFFVVGMAYGEWTENSKNSYNRWDAIARSTIQVPPGGWTAVLVSLDNVGVWNLRAENLDRWYLGQETYMRVINHEPDPSNKTEFPMPDNALFCGALSNRQKPQKHSSAASVCGRSKLFYKLVMTFSAIIFAWL